MVTDPVVSLVIDGQWRTPKCSDVQWTETAPGGCTTATFHIDDPILAARVIPETEVFISYPATGEVLWDGKVRDPGQRNRLGKRDGNIVAAGSSLRLSDRSYRLPYLVAGPGAWVDEDRDRKTGSVEDVHGGVSSESAIDGAGNTRLWLRLKARGEWRFSWRARARNTSFDDAALTIGAIHFSEKSGFTSGNRDDWKFRVIVGDLVYGAYPIEHPPAANFPSQSAFATGVYGTFPTGQSLIRVELQYVALPTIADITQDSYRVDLNGVVVMGSRLTATGAPAALPWAHTAGTEHIVADVVGRSGLIDPTRCDINIGAVLLDSLDYQDPITLTDVLDDLLGFEQSYQWIVHPSADTLKPFTWGPWPTTHRYVLMQSRGDYSEQLRDDEVYNQLTVRYRDRPVNGMWRSYTTPPLNPDIYPDIRPLVDAGQIREPDPIELDATGSRSNAIAVASALLPDLATRKVSATYSTALSVLDLQSGCMVHPWQVRPGHLALVAETNETHRITQATRGGDNGTATLTLGTPALTADRILTRLKTKRRR